MTAPASTTAASAVSSGPRPERSTSGIGPLIRSGYAIGIAPSPGGGRLVRLGICHHTHDDVIGLAKDAGGKGVPGISVHPARAISLDDHVVLGIGGIITKQLHDLGAVTILEADRGQVRTRTHIEILESDAAVAAENRLKSMSDRNIVARYLIELDYQGIGINPSAGGDLASQHHHAGFHHGFAGYAGAWILCEEFIYNCIRDLVGNLVRMTFGN